MVSARKLRVEILDARNLMPKDGRGISSPYVVVTFGSQEYKTQTKVRDLNPVWNETMLFDIEPPLPNKKVKFLGANQPRKDVLSLKVKHDKRHGPTGRSGDLGQVCLYSKHFVAKGDEVLRYYPLKRTIYKNQKGEIGLKIYYINQEEQLPPQRQSSIPEQETNHPSLTKLDNSIDIKFEPKPEPEPDEPKPEPDHHEMMVLPNWHIEEERRTNQGNKKITSLQASIFCYAFVLWRHVLDFGAVIFPYPFQLLKRLGSVMFSYVFPLLKRFGEVICSYMIQFLKRVRDYIYMKMLGG
ncbi:hypothetical protein PIB30_081381 [Stylosanthes scabra]|uniref:C2 domain-containing protein n=1 Tax=Stylosanthes scabra TaxID=79078 RepID=A0ABU6SS45_9FABA|nr:hypothetical protein [Stylosanthes scabra]